MANKSKMSTFKKLFFLTAWYIAWSTISSLYSSKKGRELQKDLKKAYEEKKDPTKILMDNFVEMHKNMFNDIKDKASSEEAKEYFKNKKEDVFKIIDKYKKEWEKMLAELKVKWKDYIEVVAEELEKFYDEKKVELDKSLKNFNLEQEDIDTYKEKLASVYKDLKSKLKKK